MEDKEEFIELNGSKIKILDNYSIFILAYRENDSEYLILRRDASKGYVVMFNLGGNKNHALEEFRRIKYRI